MFCQKCGTQAKEGAQFCHKCGARLVNVPSKSTEPTPTYATQVATRPSNFTSPQPPKQQAAERPMYQVSAPYSQQVQQPWGAQAVFPVKKKSKVLPIVLGVVGGVVFLVILFGMIGSLSNSGDNRYISLVKEGYPLDGSSSISYGEAFDYFFSNPTWEYFESTEDEDIVEFTGGCTYLDSPVTACIQFVLDVDNSTFEVSYVDFNGVPQGTAIWSELLETAFTEAEATLS